MFRSWRQSVRELGERVERLEGELGRLNMENADLKSQLKERDARIAKLESVLEESRASWQASLAPFSKDKPKRDPKKPGRKPGSKYGRQAVRAIPVPDKTFEAPCPEQCPCGGKVVRSVPGRHSAHPTRDLEVRSGSWPLPGVWSACPWPASAADFEGVRGGHGAFRAQAARLRRVPEDDLRGVVTRSAYEQMLGFPVARSGRAMQRLAGDAELVLDSQGLREGDLSDGTASGTCGRALDTACGETSDVGGISLDTR